MGRALETPSELSSGNAIGRYVVLSKIGAGAMGVVYAAYDPELDRKVALKLLRSGATGASAGSVRLLREAQALGRLSHPNVVAVHDVGTHGDAVWLAMEFVAGQTLGAWLSSGTRSWSEVLVLMRSTALGLAAAHEAGLVHRDIKPENVMLGDDGRVRVMDFGLARGAMPGTQESHGLDEGDVQSIEAPSDRRHLEAALTEAGAFLGTPAYMAPEQLASKRSDERSDQFSFCVMLWEALYGRRPFAGDTLAELATNVLDGNRRPPPRRGRVPRWLHAVIDRGLANDPTARWPSLTALLEALDSGRARTRTTRTLGIVGAVSLSGLAVWGADRIERHRAIAGCEEAGAQIDEVWSDGDRAALRGGMEATGAAHAPAVADKVVPLLDDYAAEWADARAQTCLDTDVTGAWSADDFDRAQWCLERRRLTLAALVRELEDADVEAVNRAVYGTAGLPLVSACRDVATLRRLPIPPRADRKALQALQAELAGAETMLTIGNVEDSIGATTHALARAREIDWPPAIAEAEFLLGKLHVARGAYEDAEATQQEAYFVAVKAGSSDVAFRAAEALMITVGLHLARIEDGERWGQHADVLLQSLPDPAGTREANHLQGLAVLRFQAGGYSEAAELFERALAVAEAGHGTDSFFVAQLLVNLANARQRMGAVAEALPLYERALALDERALGPEHPAVAMILHNLANAHYEMGSYAKATALFERVLAIRENTLPPEHPLLASSLDNLGLVRSATGAYAEAAALHKRALALRESVLGPEHPEVATSLGNLALAHGSTGNYAKAASLYERQLAIQERALGPEHPSVALALSNLALMRLEMGAYAEATSRFERALAIQEHALGPDHASVARSLVGLSRVALAEGRPAEALPLAERAVKALEGGDVPASDRAEARMVFARALVGTGESSTRAIGLAQQARDIWRDLGAPHQDQLAAAESFLREQDPAM